MADGGDGLGAEGGIVQSRRRPATSCTKLDRSFAPSGVCTTSGWNMVVKMGLRFVGGGERRVLGHLDRKAVRQSRHAVAVAHPDRIFTALFPYAPKQGRISTISTSARPNSAAWPPSTCPPSCTAVVCWP